MRHHDDKSTISDADRLMCIKEAWIKNPDVEDKTAQVDMAFLVDLLERTRKTHREEQRRAADRLRNCLEKANR